MDARKVREVTNYFKGYFQSHSYIRADYLRSKFPYTTMTLRAEVVGRGLNTITKKDITSKVKTYYAIKGMEKTLNRDLKLLMGRQKKGWIENHEDNEVEDFLRDLRNIIFVKNSRKSFEINTNQEEPKGSNLSIKWKRIISCS